MWKQIKLLKYHADFLTMTVNIHLGICNIHVFKQDFSPVGSSIRFKERRNVDLPEPEGPIIATTSPLWISVEIPSKTTFPSKDFAGSAPESKLLL